MNISQRDVNEAIGVQAAHIADVSKNWFFSLEQAPFQHPSSTVVNVATTVEGGGGSYDFPMAAPTQDAPPPPPAYAPTRHATSTAIGGGGGLLGPWGSVPETGQQGYTRLSTGEMVPVTYRGGGM